MKKYLKYIPNILTVIRFCFIPIIIILLSRGNYIGAIITFSLSGITDILDGAIARKYNFITDFGKLMDPLADKFTQLSMLLMLSIKHLIPIWIIIVVATKEFLMVCRSIFPLWKRNGSIKQMVWEISNCIILYSNCNFLNIKTV